jgi:hypothetical protein
MGGERAAGGPIDHVGVLDKLNYGPARIGELLDVLHYYPQKGG